MVGSWEGERHRQGVMVVRNMGGEKGSFPGWEEGKEGGEVVVFLGVGQPRLYDYRVAAGPLSDFCGSDQLTCGVCSR